MPMGARTMPAFRRESFAIFITGRARLAKTIRHPAAEIGCCAPMIYLDHNATTPLAPEALEAMRPYLATAFASGVSDMYFAVVARPVER